MASTRQTLTIQLLPEQARLLEKVARLRTGQGDSQAPVDWGKYLWLVLSRDIVACLEEIKARRGS